MAQNDSPKDFHFDVLSIRPVSGSPYSLPKMGNTNPDPNGFRSVLSVYLMLKLAYGRVETSCALQEMVNLPNWQGQLYDVAAKVSESDLRAWQHQGSEHELLRAAIRAALRERFKLSTHEQPSRAAIFELVIARGGARLNSTAPANDPRPPGAEAKRPDGGGLVHSAENGRQEKTIYDKNPDGGFVVQTVEHGRLVRTLYRNLPGGGVLRVKQEGSPQEVSENGGQVTTFYNVTIRDLVDYLNLIGACRTPVRDKTGLNGRYDFTITNLPRNPDEDAIYRYPLNRLGLQIKSGTEQRSALVIDSIEKPPPN
jgi:uncharacterized protein (TIGR03435 family)